MNYAAQWVGFRGGDSVIGGGTAAVGAGGWTGRVGATRWQSRICWHSARWWRNGLCVCVSVSANTVDFGALSVNIHQKAPIPGHHNRTCIILYFILGRVCMTMCYLHRYACAAVWCALWWWCSGAITQRVTDATQKRPPAFVGNGELHGGQRRRSLLPWCKLRIIGAEKYTARVQISIHTTCRALVASPRPRTAIMFQYIIIYYVFVALWPSGARFCGGGGTLGAHTKRAAHAACDLWAHDHCIVIMLYPCKRCRLLCVGVAVCVCTCNDIRLLFGAQYDICLCVRQRATMVTIFWVLEFEWFIAFQRG